MVEIEHVEQVADRGAVYRHVRIVPVRVRIRQIIAAAAGQRQEVPVALNEFIPTCVLGELEIPLRREVEPVVGEIQALTPQLDALYVPNIDEALDDESAKREFWAAFRVLGDWYSELPPY